MALANGSRRHHVVPGERQTHRPTCAALERPMHRACVPHEICPSPRVPREELVRQEVALQSIARRAGHHQVARIMRAATCEWHHMVQRGRPMVEMGGAVHASLTAVAKRHLPHGAFHRDGHHAATRAGSSPRHGSATRPFGCAAHTFAHGGAFGWTRPARSTTFCETNLVAGHQAHPVSKRTRHGDEATDAATNDDAPTEEKCLGSGRKVCRRVRRRIVDDVQGTPRKRGVPRVERIILLEQPGGVAQQTAGNRAIVAS